MKYGLPVFAVICSLSSPMVLADAASDAMVKDSGLQGATAVLGQCTTTALAIVSAKTGKTYSEQPSRTEKQAYGLYVKSVHDCLKAVQETLEPPMRALEQDVKIYAS